MGSCPKVVFSLIAVGIALATPTPIRAAVCEDAPAFYSRLMYTREQSLDVAALEFIRLYKNDADFYVWANTHRARLHSPGQALELYRQARATGDASGEVLMGKAPAAKIVNLRDSPVLDQPHAGLCQLCSWLVPDTLPREYGYRVLSLRAGDTVVFDDRQFKLGRFLGRGNASHVWEIEGEPGLVLKIPFYTGPPEPPAGRRPTRDRPVLSILGPRAARMFMRAFVEQSKRLQALDIPKVLPTQAGQHDAWVLIPRVQGTENGALFLQRADLRDSATVALRDLLYQRVRTFLEYMRPSSLPAVSDEEIRSTARQFIREKNDWVMVDWDF